MTLPSKQTLLIVVAIVAVPTVAVAWWLLSPLFIDKTVVEEFPYSANAVMPEGVTKTEAEGIMSGMAKVNMDKTEVMPSEMAEATIVATGQFRDADSFHKGSGAAKLYRLAEGEALLRLENLVVTNGPDLHVILTPNPDPKNRTDVHDAGYVDLGKLKGNRGDQNYDVPAGSDLGSFGSVVIYCMPFHVVFSVATLEASGG